MEYMYDHTVFYDSNPIYFIPVIFMLATLVFCFFRVHKMKKELKGLKGTLSDKLAKTAIEEPEPMMRNSLDENK